jgi:hypothetical protein
MEYIFFVHAGCSIGPSRFFQGEILSSIGGDPRHSRTLDAFPRGQTDRLDHNHINTALCAWINSLKLILEVVC